MPAAIRTRAAWEALFWSKVVKADGDACWLWAGNRSRAGYGRLWSGLENRTVQAHRAAIAIAGVAIPPGMDVCHHCDNPPCVNPAHLFVGTRADNMADKARKGRAGGIFHPQARLTPDQVDDVRRRRAAGMRLAQIASEYGISEGHVCQIARGGRWKGTLQ